LTNRARRNLFIRRDKFGDGWESNTITRADLADAVHREVGLPRQESGACGSGSGHDFRHACRRESVKLSSFGSFVARQERPVGRNPKTGEEVPIDPRRVLVFKPSQVLKERIDAALSKITLNWDAS
jgi:integration host factor subunit alpha